MFTAIRTLVLDHREGSAVLASPDRFLIVTYAVATLLA